MPNEENMPLEQEMTAEQIAEAEAEREQARAQRLAPYHRAAQQRRESAAVVAEHDEAIAEILYEMTMRELGLGV